MSDLEKKEPRLVGGLPTQEGVTSLALSAATALALYLRYRRAVAFLPAITWAPALAVVAQPFHSRLARHVRRPNAAAGLSLAAGLSVAAALVAASAAFVIHQLASQAARGAQALRSQAESGQLQAALEGNAYLSRVAGWAGAKPDVRAAAEWATNSAGPYLSSFAGGTLWTLAQLVVTFFILFYLLRDRRPSIKADGSPLTRPLPDGRSRPQEQHAKFQHLCHVR